MSRETRRLARETEEFEAALYGTVTRRTLNKALFLTAVASDTAMGYGVELGMNDHPETRVFPHPTSEHTIIVMGGAGNDGIALAEMLQPVFGQYANLLAVRYPENNINPVELDEAIFRTMEEHGLHNPSWYLCSAAGQFAAYSIATHAASPERQARFGRSRVVQLHCSPSSEDDLTSGYKGFAELHGDDLLKRSRLFDLALKGLLAYTVRDGGDTSMVTTQGIHRQLQALRDVDSITGATQIGAIRDIDLADGYLAGAADRFVFVHPSEDPVVNPERALAGWRRICGSVEDVLDLNAPAGKPTHATNVFPRTLDAIFRESLVH